MPRTRSPLAVVAVAACILFGSHPAAALDFETIRSGNATYTVCRVDLRKDQLDLFHRGETGVPFKRFRRLETWLRARDRALPFAMNAGMYHGDFSAVGLFVADGRTLAPLNTARGEGNFFWKPNGVFALTADRAWVVESSEYPRIRGRVRLATQSGPLLLRNGRMHPGFRADSPSRLFRNGVGVPSPGIALFAISETPVNFHEFATFFRDRLRCRDALFLDGTISSLHAPALGRSDFRMDLGPILGVTEALTER